MDCSARAVHKRETQWARTCQGLLQQDLHGLFLHAPAFPSPPCAYLGNQRRPKLRRQVRSGRFEPEFNTVGAGRKMARSAAFPLQKPAARLHESSCRLADRELKHGPSKIPQNRKHTHDCRDGRVCQADLALHDRHLHCAEKVLQHIRGKDDHQPNSHHFPIQPHPPASSSPLWTNPQEDDVADMVNCK